MASPAPPRASIGGPIQYELRIGVTGHRELKQPGAVEAAVRALLEQVVRVLNGASAEPHGPHGSPQTKLDGCDRLLARGLGFLTRVTGPILDVLAGKKGGPLYGLFGASHWPRVPVSPDRPDDAHRTKLKLTVVSSLATGADQIVANVVCSMVTNPRERNRYLEAVLPFPQSIYEQDFTEEKDLVAFRSLLSLDRGNESTHPDPTVGFPEFPACPDGAGRTRQVTREEAYAEAGRIVVDTSEIIVAIWDPSHEMKPGGPEATIRYALGFGRVVLWINPADLSAGQFLLRRKNVNKNQTPVAGHEGIVVERIPDRAKELSENFHRLAAYNRDAAVNARLLTRELQKHKDDILKAAKACPLPEPALRVLLNELLPYFARADHLGTRYRELRDFSARLWPTTAAVLVSLMAFQIIFLPGSYRLAWIELAVLSLCYVSYRVSVYDGWHDKWLNDRRLAEGLRAAMFISLVRQGDDLARERGQTITPPGFFGHVRNPLPFYSAANAWFVATLKRVVAKERRKFAASLDLSNADQCNSVAKFLREAWILHQLRHHQERAQARHWIARRASIVRHGLILIIALVAAFHAIGVGHAAPDDGSPFVRWDLWIAFATVALPAWAAASHVMSSLDDHERMAKRSTRMASLLDALAGQLKDVRTADQLNACVNEAERVLELESTEWAESLAGRRPEFTA
jgi:hypothetical protein